MKPNILSFRMIFSDNQTKSLLVLFQVVLFSVLFAIWILPNTILIRNLCLSLGACIGVYEIYIYRSQIQLSRSISLLLLGGLFLWIIFHLLFLSNNYIIQQEEFFSVWKRSFLAALFGIGFGLGLINLSTKSRHYAWIIFYLGLMAPTIIYLVKFALLIYGRKTGTEVSEYWRIYAVGSPTPFYVAKTAYMGFCAPVVAIALGQLYRQLQTRRWLNLANLVYLATIPAILFVFYVENVKNGILYSLIFILLFVILVALKSFKVAPLKNCILILLLATIASAFVFKNIQENPSWKTLFADARIAVQTERYPNWQCGPRLGYPNNDLGKVVSATNYERIAWALNAAKLVAQYPLGYGLVERSFRQRGNVLWPGSCLSQSHSGWLDLALGIGLPGMLLLAGTFIFSLRTLISIKVSELSGIAVWISMSICSLIGFLLIWCTTEISQKVFLEELIFFIGFAIGLGFLATSIRKPVHSN